MIIWMRKFRKFSMLKFSRKWLIMPISLMIYHHLPYFLNLWCFKSQWFLTLQQMMKGRSLSSKRKQKVIKINQVLNYWVKILSHLLRRKMMRHLRKLFKKKVLNCLHSSKTLTSHLLEISQSHSLIRWIQGLQKVLMSMPMMTTLGLTLLRLMKKTLLLFAKKRARSMTSLKDQWNHQPKKILKESRKRRRNKSKRKQSKSLEKEKIFQKNWNKREKIVMKRSQPNFPSGWSSFLAKMSFILQNSMG